MWNMEGLILIGFCQEDYRWLRQHMRIPFVAYDVPAEVPERFCSLNIDNYSGGYQMGRYFKSLGHKRLLCISDNDTFIDHERYQGFCAGSGGADLMQIPMQKKAREEFYRDNFQRICGYSAVFAVSDYYAIDLMRFLLARGLRVPEDISVAGFDDMPICAQVFPTLTSVRQDGVLRAGTAMEKLAALRAGKVTGAAVTLPVQLVVRESTGPCAE